LIVVFVAVVLACLGALMLAGFVVLYAQIGALADQLRDARAADALKLATQLDGIAGKQQGMRLDLAAMTKELEAQRRNVAALALHIEGPPSLRRPVLPRT
jgi:hypothetical protein